jgi:hypothetical protein
MKTLSTPAGLLCVLVLAGCATSPDKTRWSADLTRNSIVSRNGIVLRGNDRLSTPNTFRPPVEIKIVAQTDSTNLRMAYAADQIIFNWELDREQLRVDGGPADGCHKSGLGSIPIKKDVTIRWIVTPRSQSVYVDDDLRFEHLGDYSKIDRCVTVFPAADSRVVVKSLQVKELKDSSHSPF